jgi:hypothetical protein
MLAVPAAAVRTVTASPFPPGSVLSQAPKAAGRWAGCGAADAAEAGAAVASAAQQAVASVTIVAVKMYVVWL